MRTILIIALMVFVTELKAQTFLPGSPFNSNYAGALLNNTRSSDTSFKKKWFTSKYSGISTSFTFFNGGNATVVSAPVGLQLNHRINNNLFGFANVSLAPSYISSNRSFINTDFNKLNANNSFYKPNSVGVYSSAALGLQYVNDERTFSISGSIGVERSSYPMPQYYNMNSPRYNQTSSPNR